MKIGRSRGFPLLWGGADYKGVGSRDPTGWRSLSRKGQSSSATCKEREESTIFLDPFSFVGMLL